MECRCDNQYLDFIDTYLPNTPGGGGGGSHIHVLYGEVPRFSPPFLKPISSTIGYGFLALWATALLGGISS